MLFTIDVSESMLRPVPTSEDKQAKSDSPLSAAIKCAYELMTQRIICNPSDMMGVLLHGVDKSNLPAPENEEEGLESNSFPQCYLLVDLGIPKASDVKKLSDLIDDQAEFHETFVPATGSTSIANTIFYASNLFSSRAANFASRRLFIVTDNDRPNGKDEEAKIQATQRAKDLYDLGVTIELFPLVKPGGAFDRSKFYDVSSIVKHYF